MSFKVELKRRKVSFSKLIDAINVESENAYDKREIDLGLHIIDSVYKQSGISQLSGFGMSSLQLDETTYKTKMMLHHYGK